MSVVKLKRSRDAAEERPMLVRSGQASSTYLRKLASALGAGSVATTSNPRARYSTAQLAPMSPVPTMAIRRTRLFRFMVQSLLLADSALRAGPETLAQQPLQLVPPDGNVRARADRSIRRAGAVVVMSSRPASMVMTSRRRYRR